MIRANHIRIGNWVMWYSSSGWQTVRVNSIIIENLEELEPEMETMRIKPINLSAEILEKCGFTKSPGEDGWIFPLYPDIKSFLFINPSTGRVGIYEDLEGTGNFTVIKNKFTALHHLQNLVFTLTGKELAIIL